MKAQQFAIGESLTVEDLAEDQSWGTKGWGLYPQAVQPPEAVLGVTIVLFQTLKIYHYLFTVKLGVQLAGSDHLSSNLHEGWRNGICRLNGALDLHRFKSI